MRPALLIGLSVFLSAFPASTLLGKQNVTAASANTIAYANTTEGFAQLLTDIRVAAQEGNQEQLAAFIKNTEIPNCDAWLHSMYDSDKADSWMGLCEAKSRDPRERDLQDLFKQIAKQDGKFITRKVNDNPQPGKGLEWGWLQAIKQPLDIYWASWLPSDEPKESEADPIGYFMFIDGAFRWESGIQSFKPAQTEISQAPNPEKTSSPQFSLTIELLTNPEAADLMPNLRNIYRSVKSKALETMPPSVPKGDRGVVSIRVQIQKDGTLAAPGPTFVLSSHKKVLDDHAMAAISKAAPFDHLPEQLSAPSIELRLTFFYNLPPPSR
jgi:hypothetical protein